MLYIDHSHDDSAAVKSLEKHLARMKRKVYRLSVRSMESQVVNFM